MAVVEKSVLIEKPAQLMFELVDRVEDYPQFLPWCGGTELHLRDDVHTEATIHISYHGVKSHFSTRNTKEFPRTMQIALKDGPFRHLDGGWRFTPLGEGACKVEFRLHYEFTSKLLEKAIGPVFNYVANSFVEAFVKRADRVSAAGSNPV